MHLKNLVLIAALQLIGGFAFAQKKRIVKQTESDITFTVEEIDGTVYKDESARFPGGMDSLYRFLATNIHYPERAVKEKLEGICYILFVVTEQGTVSDVKVEKGVRGCKECDQEAIRVIQAMPAWEPRKVNDIKVDSKISLPISFKL